MVYNSESPRRSTSGRAIGTYSARGVGSSSFTSPGREGGGMTTYLGVRASGRAGGPLKTKEFKFSFEEPKTRPLSARAQVRATRYTAPTSLFSSITTAPTVPAPPHTHARIRLPERCQNIYFC